VVYQALQEPPAFQVKKVNQVPQANADVPVAPEETVWRAPLAIRVRPVLQVLMVPPANAVLLAEKALLVTLAPWVILANLVVMEPLALLELLAYRVLMDLQVTACASLRLHTLSLFALTSVFQASPVQGAMMARMAEMVRPADVVHPVKWAFQALEVPWVKSARLVRTVGCMARRGRLVQQGTIEAFQINPCLFILFPFTVIHETRAPIYINESGRLKVLLRACHTRPLQAACAYNQPREQPPIGHEKECKSATP
jgi:hypothetical protein